MFEVWLHSDLNASWEKVIDALDTMEYHRLAQKVKTEYADVYMAQKQHGMSSSFAVIQGCVMLTEPVVT